MSAVVHISCGLKQESFNYARNDLSSNLQTDETLTDHPVFLKHTRWPTFYQHLLRKSIYSNKTEIKKKKEKEKEEEKEIEKKKK